MTVLIKERLVEVPLVSVIALVTRPTTQEPPTEMERKNIPGPRWTIRFPENDEKQNWTKRDIKYTANNPEKAKILKRSYSGDGGVVNKPRADENTRDLHLAQGYSVLGRQNKYIPANSRNPLIPTRQTRV